MSKTSDILDRFKIGEFVHFNKAAVKVWTGASPEYHASIISRNIKDSWGWISGATELCEGILKTTGESKNWSTKKKVLLLTVKTSWLRKPILVFPEDVTPQPEEDEEPITLY